MMDSKCFVQLVQSRLAASIRRKGKAFNGIISNAAHHTAHVDHDGLTLLKILKRNQNKCHRNMLTSKGRNF